MTTKKPKKPAKRKAAKPDPREKISVTALITALEAHVLGAQEMTPTQVSAALALLKKILPDASDPARRAAETPVENSHENALSELE